MVVKKTDTINIYDIDGNIKKTVVLPKQIFSVSASVRLLAQYVRVYLANQRQGNASTKTRGQIAGSTRKIYRQKGTGRARHGDIRAPIFVGGGVVGGPSPKDHSLKINQKQKRKALFSSLTIKNKEKAIIGLENGFLKITPKTKTFVNFLKKINLASQRKILLVLPKLEKNNLVLASRNLPALKFVEASAINPYLILNSQTIIFLEDSLPVLEKHFLKK